MPNELLEHPSNPIPLEGQPAPGASGAEAADGARLLPARRPGYAQTWQQGAMVALVAVSFFILWMAGAVTIFSVMSTALLTADAVLVLGLIGLTTVLFVLLARSQRRWRQA